MPTAQLDSTPLEYIERGAGEPVVLVHGSLGDLRSWEPQMDALAADHRVVAYSRRYHHPNDAPAEDAGYDAALHADDLVALLDELTIESAHLVGSSYGAFTSLFASMRHPDRVRSQVLSEPPALRLLDGHPEGRRILDRFLDEVWEPAGALLAEGRMEEGVRTFVDGLFGAGAFAQLPAEVHDLIMDNADAFQKETASTRAFTPFTCDDAAVVTTPTLLLCGGSSLRMFHLVVDELARCLPDNECVRLPETSHDIPAERAADFNELVTRFIDEHSP